MCLPWNTTQQFKKQIINTTNNIDETQKYYTK